MARRRGNKTKYDKELASGVRGYRKYPDWRKRMAQIGKDGLDSEESRGMIRLPDTGRCPHCGKKITRVSPPDDQRDEEHG